MTTTAVLEGGFADPARGAAFAFRAVMNAMAQPGRIGSLTGGQAPAPMSPAAATVVLTLCDADTGLYLAPSYDTPELRGWVAFHCSAPIVAPEQAAFALGPWDALAATPGFPIGTPEYPDRSTTLIVELPALTAQGAELTGPGIKDSAQLSLPERRRFQDNAALFPLGLDFIFTAGDQVAALPRTTQVR